MVFSSVVFIFYFLPAFLLFYVIAGGRNAALLTASLVFYTWGEGGYVLLLLALVAVNFYGALWVERMAPAARWRPLTALVTANLLVLGLFKYTNFLLGVTSGLTDLQVPVLDLALPLGISFFTFQLVSYLVDVSRGAVPAERNFVRLATYIMMFPHLVAGPIVRYADIAEEMRGRRYTVERIGLGVQYFIVGLSQKVLIANTVAVAADKAFTATAVELSAPMAWIGAVAYSLQIYFDFCGYSNMAIGLAFLLGFRFPRNFNYPYAAVSVTDFWRRWHMSLSSWFRDYVYIPMGGNRHGTARTLRNLLVLFLLTGLWHGAAWTFVIWGLFHGAFLVLERLWLGQRLTRTPLLLSRVYTLLVILVGWVFFRADHLAHATIYFRAMLGWGEARDPLPITAWLTPEVATMIAVGIVFSFPVVPWIFDRIGHIRLEHPRSALPPHLDTVAVHALPVALLALGFALSLALMVTSTLNPFLYFRF
jgi:alginate O-acetyltransferase complex protein AlgI